MNVIIPGGTEGGGGDRHREKPLSLRLGPLREAVEQRAKELNVPVRRFILDAIARELYRTEKEAR